MAKVRLTTRQDSLARNVALGMTQRQAAIEAGYKSDNLSSLDTTASDTLSLPKVQGALERYRDRLARRVELSEAEVLNDIREVAAIGIEVGQLGPAVRALELLGKKLGIWIERSQSTNYNIDVQSAQIASLLQLAKTRRDPVDITPKRSP